MQFIEKGFSERVGCIEQNQVKKVDKGDYTQLNDKLAVDLQSLTKILRITTNFTVK